MNNRNQTRTALRAIGATLLMTDNTADIFSFPSEAVENRFHEIRYSLSFGATNHGGSCAVHYDQPTTIPNAPELLEACKVALEYGERCTIEKRVLDVLRAAIQGASIDAEAKEYLETLEMMEPGKASATN